MLMTQNFSPKNLDRNTFYEYIKPIHKTPGIVEDFIGNYQQTFDQMDAEI